MPDTNKQIDFSAFCRDQVKRLSQFKAFGFLELAALKDYRRWLERKCSTRDRVERVMDAAIECEDLPTIAKLGSILAELFGQEKPSIREASQECQYCAGTGWIIVTRGDSEGADRCGCGGAPPLSDPGSPGKPPRLSLIEIEQLKRENQEFAAQLSRDLAAKIAKPRSIPPKPARAITVADFDAVNEKAGAK